MVAFPPQKTDSSPCMIFPGPDNYGQCVAGKPVSSVLLQTLPLNPSSVETGDSGLLVVVRLEHRQQFCDDERVRNFLGQV